MSDDYADRLYNRLQSNYDYYVDNLNSTNITNKFDLFSGDDLQEFYNTNETIQNFINENVTVESFGEVFYAMSSDTINLYIFYCNDDNNPIIEPSFIYNQFKFNNVPCLQIRIDTAGNLILSSASITSKTFGSNDVGDYFYHQNYENKQAVIDDIIIENDTITKVANYIPFIFNGEDLEFPFTKVQYSSEYYRLAEPLKNGYINPPIYDNGSSTIIGTITPSGDDYILNGEITEEINGEQQEELINSKIDEITESMSGELAENELFGILQKYEDKIFGSFIGEEDFKIEWNDILYAGEVIIPKGEINFSKMCRENETLGNVKTTINILLDFFLLSNCVIYLYNLLLASIGIDNPYLYETQPERVETVTYDTDIDTGITIETRTLKNRNGQTFRTRRKF